MPTTNKSKETKTTKKRTTKKVDSPKQEVAAYTKKEVAVKAKGEVTIKKKREVAVKTKKEVAFKTKKEVAIKTKKEVMVQEEPLKVLIVAGEATPFIKTGGLADVAGSLPKALVKKNIDARVVIPMHKKVRDKFKSSFKFVGYLKVQLAWRFEYAGVFSTIDQGVTYYFIDNERYFARDKVYGEFDDGERFAFFSKAVLECLKIMNFKLDIIHANDWHTALVPVFLDCFYREDDFAKKAQTVFTIHNIEFQGQYDKFMISDVLGLNHDQGLLVEYKDCCNYMKGGIESAGRVTTVSNTYAKEILDPYYGYGMQDILKDRQFKLSGIVNGINTEENNPLTDKNIFKNYDINSWEIKKENKLQIQRELGLEENENIPLIAMVSRLSHQKGIDLVTAGLDRIMSLGCQLIVLGTGDSIYEDALRGFEQKYKGKMVAYIGFSSKLASKLYASSDMFLMPSQFEPCGLSQLIALRYGSIPIVRETGGLKDTVIPYNHETHEGVGFTFKTYNVEDMTYAVERAVGLYKDYKEDWNILVNNAMKADYSWDNIADKYIELYKSLRK